MRPRRLQRAAHLRQVESERQLLNRYIKDNRLDVSAMEGVVPETVRVVLLQWIAQANMTAGKTGKTEYGQEFCLIRKEGTCVLRCRDGRLRMPAYVLEFK